MPDHAVEPATQSATKSVSAKIHEYFEIEALNLE